MCCVTKVFSFTTNNKQSLSFFLQQAQFGLLLVGTWSQHICKSQAVTAKRCIFNIFAWCHQSLKKGYCTKIMELWRLLRIPNLTSGLEMCQYAHLWIRHTNKLKNLEYDKSKIHRLMENRKWQLHWMMM